MHFMYHNSNHFDFQMLVETESWPYNFPLSEDYPYADERGIVSGRLLVHDR